MMNNLYYHYWTVSLSHGLIILLFNILNIIGAHICGDKISKSNYYYSYFQFLKHAEFKFLFPQAI